MISYQSTPKEPIKFFETCFYGSGLSCLRDKFEGNLFPEGYYNRERDVMLVQRYLPLGDERGELLEADTNLREIELSFEYFLLEEFQRQIIVSKGLIKEYYFGDKGVAAMLYDRLLISSLKLLKKGEKREKTIVQSAFERSVIQILNFTVGLYRDIFPDSRAFEQVRSYMVIKTGKFKKPLGAIFSDKSLRQLQHILKMSKRLNFIDGDAREEDFFSVFKGRRPANKIIWTDTLFTLSFLFRKIEGIGIESVGHGKWECVVDCFSHYKRGQIFPKQLLKPSAGKNERIDELNNILAEFNAPSE